MQFSLRVEHEIALWRADTGQARAGIGLEVGFISWLIGGNAAAQEYF
jgi:hypothetical protein